MSGSIAYDALATIYGTSIFDILSIHSSPEAKRERSYLETRYRRVLADGHITQRDARIVLRKS